MDKVVEGASIAVRRPTYRRDALTAASDVFTCMSLPPFAFVITVNALINLPPVCVPVGFV